MGSGQKENCLIRKKTPLSNLSLFAIMRKSVTGSGALLLLILFLIACCNRKTDFYFSQTDVGVELTENGKPVFFYQKTPKSLSGEYVCNNYIHPLYNLNGDVLTEEFPPDHPYHRGIFWTWHQLFIDTCSIGDGWINDGITQDVAVLKTETGQNRAVTYIESYWKSKMLPDGKPFMRELTSIIVYPAESGLRNIDFIIKLYALVDKLEIGGSDDEKGYGGFCLRLDIPEDMIFTSENGTVTPVELQVAAGRWMDFSGSFGKGHEKNGIAIFCHPDNPLYPSPWILRQKGSMQNAVYPGRERIKLEMNKPLILKYRLVIHNGILKIPDLNKLQAEYSE